MRPIILIPLLVALAACGSRDNDPGPGGVSVGEARALDDAAKMLDARKLPPLPDPHPELGDGPGVAASGDPVSAQASGAP